jgi:DNA-binding SARP family transcriptional activator
VNAPIQARLLGPLEIEHAGRPLAVGGRAQRALLARLLLDANRTVSVDRLVEDLWGEASPATAPKMVQIYVSMLRKALPAGTLVTRSPGYAVELPPDAVDLVRFERLRERGQAALAAGSAAGASDLLRQALALWHGPALAEFHEPFAEIEARRLEDQHLACLEDRIDADLTLGRDASLIGEVEALVARHPLRERARGQLMLALYRAGRQADALAGYRGFREMLSAELGIEPSPALRELERRILQHDPALDRARSHGRTRRHAGAPARAVRQGAVRWSSPCAGAHAVPGRRVWQPVPAG